MVAVILRLTVESVGEDIATAVKRLHRSAIHNRLLKYFNKLLILYEQNNVIKRAKKSCPIVHIIVYFSPDTPSNLRYL